MQPSGNVVSGEAGADPRLEKESAGGGLFGSGSDLKIDLESGTPEQVWRKFFAKNRPSPTSLTTMVLRLHQQQKHQHVMAAINEALIAGQSQPWMYDVLAMSMQITGRPQPEIERVLLSRVDFTATDVPNMLFSAAYLVRFGATRSALTLYRQASRLAPTRSEPYALGLKLAERLGDDDAIQWASTGILTYTWPSDYRRRHQLALDVAADTVTALKKVGKKQRAGELEEAVASARQRDLVVVLSWNGPGELDLQVDEPLGTVCHFDSRQTRSGGVLVHDGFGPVQRNCYEEYVCAFAAAGEYRLSIKHVDGDIVGKRAKLTIRRYVGTGYEQAHVHPVVFDSRDKVVRLSLQKGRREKLSDPLPRTSPEFATARGGRRAGRRFRFGQPEQQQGSGRGNADGRVGYTPVVSMLSEGVANTTLAVVSGDRRYVRLTVDALFSSIIDVATFSFRR